VREAKGDSLLVVVIDVTVDQKVSFDRHQSASGFLLVPIILYRDSDLQLSWFDSGGNGGGGCPKRGEGIYGVLPSRQLMRRRTW